ncbi:MAG: glycosyltransferase [Dysgonamonadaceae bacterium]|jgi:glycosyltransferase involved in cell wall biosynthesis|nr:glycosyltransferase [Dysgonamonadaceae bacterium]
MIGLIEIILLSILAASFITQMVFYWVVLGKPYYHMRGVRRGRIRLSSDTPPVSVIVYVKTRYHNLLDFLPSLLEQEYPQFEVIVINDGLTEESSNILFRLQEKYPNLYSTHIPEETRSVSRRKLGLTLGIKAAKHDCLLFTEADSHPRSNNWIGLMSRHFTNKNMVLGMSAKENAEGFFSKFIMFDYFFSNLQTLSMALFNHPHAGSGRNLIYSKTYFNEQTGAAMHRTLWQIEDDLFINNIASESATKVELSADSVIMTGLTGYDWRQEKRDKAFIKQFYRIGPIAVWSLESLSRVVFTIAVIACLGWAFLNPIVLPHIGGAAAGCYLIKFLSQLFIINRTASLLQLKKFYLTLPLYNLMQLIVNAYFSLYRTVHRKENYIFKYEKR